MHEYTKTTTTAVPKKLKTYAKDPIKVQEYTLRNGLRLLMSVNKDEPRVYTEIAVRAGSKHDPADTTGLAHYFEHMMFKGTDRLGSLDWAKEKPLLDQIERLFEEHRREADPARKKDLYAEIDRLSYEAAKLAAANEYDKLVSAIGAKNTNAYTWVEQTVYVNDIPANELERWFRLEAERFRRPILRLFHTELETVFEEYNINQDRDMRKTLREMQAMLTPTHPYGTQTTLGRGEDLKNPSQTNIYRFFDQYYVPNNMAIVLCGDFDPQEAVALAEQHWGHFEKKVTPKFTFEPQRPLTARTHRDVQGNEAPWVEMGWRLEGAKSAEAMLLPLVANVLQNGQAGLFDLNLMQKQQLLEAYAYPREYEDYSNFLLYAKPREGQSHADVERLLMAEIEKLQRGEFEDWLPQAAVNDLKLSEVKYFEKNEGRAAALTSAFVLGVSWSDMVQRWQKLEQITKADLMQFAQQHLRADNCAVVYKHQGPDASVMKVEKPPITAVEVNRTDASGFAQSFLAEVTPDIEPQFIDFKKVIKTSSIAKNLKLRSVTQKGRQRFRLDYCFDMGKTSERRLSLLVNYLPLLGTSKYSASEVQQQLYRLGVNVFATCQDEHFYLSLTGLPASLVEGIALMEHLLRDAQPDAAALQNLVADTLLRRENNKSDKRFVLTKGLLNTARYGSDSPFRMRLNKEELMALKPAELTDLLHALPDFQHEVYYTGPHSARQVAQVLKEKHPVAATLRKPLPARKFRELDTRRDRVVFVNFPMVQVELMLYSKGTPRFSLDEHVFAEWYNQYFGYGLSSIVFQEIRESKALAYSAYAFASSPQRRQRAHFLQAYVGTQPDKLREAVEAFQTIMEDMPVSAAQIEHARQSVLKQIAAGRIAPSELYWTWRANQQRGIKGDLRELVYKHLQTAQADDLLAYQEQHVKGRRYTWLVIGERERIDFKYLRKIGKVEEMTIEEVLGY
jgi:predicted Zn-dependent peptidase